MSGKVIKLDKRYYKSCHGKAKLSQEDADELVIAMYYLDKYKCGYCGYWHVGHHPQQSRKGRLKK